MDYYQILGVSKSASESEIKKAFKAKSMEHHPDRGGNEAKFKEINEAYQTLKDPQKRAEYDNPQPQIDMSSPFGFHTQQPFGGFGGQFGEIFKEFYFGGQGHRQARNKDVKIGYTIDFIEVYEGKHVSASYKLPSGKKEVADITIPAGVKDGDTIRFAGLGDNSIPHAPRGNLDVIIKVRPLKGWTREGDNIITVRTLDVFDLLLGTSIELNLPNNKTFSLNISAGTKPGVTFAIHGHGIPNTQTGRTGNVLVKIESHIPKVVDKNILNKIKEIKNEIDNSTK